MDDKIVLRHEPIRILQVVTVMNRAGLETMLMNYYRNIDRTKIQFDFLVHRPEKGDYDDEITSLGGRIYRFDPITPKNMLGYRRLHKSFFAEHPEYKVVHSHLDALSTLPLSAAKDAGVPVRIAHSHTNSFDRDIKYPIKAISKKFIKRYATDYFGCSKDAIHFMFGEVDQYEVITNAVNVTDFVYNKEKRNEMRKSLGIDSQFVVGHVGRFNYPKNHEFLIDVFKSVRDKNKDATLLLVGAGEGEADIRQKVKDLGLESSVIFLGLRTDIADLMQAMDIFVMPSRYEGIPVVSIEAQAVGLPCVFSDVVATSIDVTGNCAFISLDEAKTVWAETILAKGVGQNRTVHIDAHYDIAQAANVLESLYLAFFPPQAVHGKESK